jgi:polyisoprenyl-phosphate glycosyltransferase
MRASDSGLLSVVVPVYNEEAVLPELRARITSALADHDFECILVNDGSNDATPVVIRTMTEQDPRFKLVSLSRNFGQQAAIVAGLTFARGACVAVMDADLQDPPELVPAMAAEWGKGADVVYAVRTARRGRRVKHAVAVLYYRLLSQMASTKMPVDTGDFAVMDRRVVDLIVGMGERHPYVRGLRSWVGFRQVAMPYVHDRRAKGEAKYTVWKSFDLAVAGVVSFSAIPLRFVTLTGGALIALSMLAGAVLVGGSLALGWQAGVVTSLLPLAGAGFGLQLFVIGLLGEYVGRVLEQVQQRPVFIVDEVIGLDAEAPTRAARAP